MISRWFERYGYGLLIVVYFIPGIRHVTGYFSGITKMPYKKFAINSYLGALIWSITFISLGKVLGDNYDKFNNNMNLNDIYKIIHKYLAPNEDKAFSNILNAIQTIKNFQEMQSLMESFRKLNSDNDSHSNPDLNNILNFISENNSISNNNNINIEELMQLFSMFNQ